MTDSEGRLRVDARELAADVQDELRRRWQAGTEELLAGLADRTGSGGRSGSSTDSVCQASTTASRSKSTCLASPARALGCADAPDLRRHRARGSGQARRPACPRRAAREWRALRLLAEHAPGLAPEPLRADLDAHQPVVEMSLLPGVPLGDAPLTPEQESALVRPSASCGSPSRPSGNRGPREYGNEAQLVHRSATRQRRS